MIRDEVIKLADEWLKDVFNIRKKIIALRASQKRINDVYMTCFYTKNA